MTLSVSSIAAMIMRVRGRWRDYVIQSALGCRTDYLILLILSIENAVVIAALAASVFIVFGRPQDVTARPQNIAGGHPVGFTVGASFALLPSGPSPLALAWYALAVGLPLLLMLTLYVHHPPAAATALGVAMRGYSVELLVGVLTIIFILAVVHYAAKPRLRNLY